MFGLLVGHQSGIYYNPQNLIFQNTLSPRNLQHFLHSDNKLFPKVAQLAGGMGATSSHVRSVGAQVQIVCQSKPRQRCEAQSLSSDVICSILLHSHYIPISALISTQLFNFQGVQYMGDEGKELELLLPR